MKEVKQLLVGTMYAGWKIQNTPRTRRHGLWGGFGSAIHITLVSPDDGEGDVRCVLKRITPGKGRGIGHRRKVESYLYEAQFYQEFSPPPAAYFPNPIAISVQKESNSVLILLEDLLPQYPESLDGYEGDSIESTIRWLAGFHAFHYEGEGSTIHDRQGSYWYLDTRPNEFENLRGQARWRRLERCARALSERLKTAGRPERKHRTLLHGDAKAANFLHTSDETACAAYDFQYVGSGYGEQDLVMLLVSSAAYMDEETEKEYLASYNEALCELCPKARESHTLEICTMHYELALLDYVRFMAGWGMWGNDEYAVRRANQILDKLDGGKLLSMKEYAKHIEKVYPLP